MLYNGQIYGHTVCHLVQSGEWTVVSFLQVTLLCSVTFVCLFNIHQWSLLSSGQSQQLARVLTP